MSEPKQFLCSHLVTVLWSGQRASANMEKIWSGGATVNLEQPIPPGCAIEIASHEWRVAGTVAQCRHEDDGYIADLEFVSGYKWHKENFEPEHLTDLDMLLLRKQRP